MSLLAALDRVADRTGLDRAERLDLASAVSAALDLGVLWAPGALPSPLAAKLAVRTYRAAVSLVLAERLLRAPGEAEAPEVAFLAADASPPNVEAPPAVPPPPASVARPKRHPPRRGCAPETDPVTGKRIRRCGICRAVGHRFETCPLREGAPKVDETRPKLPGTGWRGYSAVGER